MKKGESKQEKRGERKIKKKYKIEIFVLCFLSLKVALLFHAN